MNKKLKGGVVIYLSLIVMFIGLAILYFLNTSGTTIFQNFKTKSVRTQLINNINSGLAIATDAELPSSMKIIRLLFKPSKMALLR